MEPDADTVRYASQFEKEERGIWFANDENRVWQMEKRNTSQETETSAKGSVPQGIIQYVNGENQVNLEISGDTKRMDLRDRPLRKGRRNGEKAVCGLRIRT